MGDASLVERDELLRAMLDEVAVMADDPLANLSIITLRPDALCPVNY